MQENKKLEIVTFNNSTKPGVDVIDVIVKNFSTKSASRKWPLAIFFDILDKADLNACILFKEATGMKMSRKECFIRLAEELVWEIDENNDLEVTNTEGPCKKKKQCYAKHCKNKFKESCQICKKVVCGPHSKKVTTVFSNSCK